jgi:hypothetical protein
MSPKPYDSPGRYLVPSRSRAGEVHLVDLLAYRLNGRCDCPDFTVRREPMLRKGASPGNSTRCKHIHAARDAMLQLILEEIRSSTPAEPSR